MTQKNKIDQAWDQLRGRLEKDGLLTEDAPVNVRFFHRPALLWAAAVLLLLVATGSFYWYQTNKNTQPSSLLTLSNKEQEVTLVSTLEDGSTVYLSHEASLRYPAHFPEEKREVFLAGDAFFDIYRNEDSPFLIETEEVRIEVLGTAFSIQNRKGQPFQLAVEKGKVGITRKKGGAFLLVQAGEKAVFSSDGFRKQAVSPDEFVKYRQKIYFKDELLRDLIRVINQRASGPSIRLSPEVGNRRLNYTYIDDTTLDVAKVICLALNLKYEVNGQFIRIVPL